MMKLLFPVGIELEAESYNDDHDRPVKFWDVKLDGSCGPATGRGTHTSGPEFVSKKLESLEDLIGAVEEGGRSFFSSAVVNDRCGFHTHLGFSHIRDLSAKYRVFRFAVAYEELFWRMANPTADREHFCKRLSNTVLDGIKNGNGFKVWEQESVGRYWWLNGQSMSKHGTIEMRLMNAAYTADEVMGWISIWQCMMHAAVCHDVKLDWDSTGHKTKSNLLADLQVDKTPFFGEIAKKFVKQTY